MKSNLSQAIVVTLIMSEEEADWLHRAMQNPLHGGDPNQESQEDAVMRQKFWEASKTF